MSCENILVVEDDKVTQRCLQARLSEQGYQVTTASTVAEALHALRAGLPDLMLLDLTLLDSDPFGGLTDGFALLSVLHRNFPETLCPVIIHTGDTSDSVEARAQADGVFAVFQKGTPTSELLAAVRPALDTRDTPVAA